MMTGEKNKRKNYTLIGFRQGKEPGKVIHNKYTVQLFYEINKY